MQLIIEKTALRLCSVAELDIEKTFECGQCFRWNMDASGVYTGVHLGRAARVWREDGQVLIDAPERDRELWRDYFDLELDYDSAAEDFHGIDYMEKCIEFGRGIRILKQDRWEALCSFIISQCNNIPRIKKIVETLCRCFGDEINYMGETYYAFPSAERIALLSEPELAPLRSGYRAAYILAAARDVHSGTINFEELGGLSHPEALKAVRQMRGVGEKVANCFILFGLHKMEAFPIDVWMKRALKEHFPEKFDPAVFGDYAGLAQQYIFYHARSGGDK